MQITLQEYDTLVSRGLVPPLDAGPKDTKTVAGDRIILKVYGAPVSKPRMTQRDKWQKRPATTKYWEWADRVRKIAGNMPDANSIAAVNWTAYFEPPKSWKKSKRIAIIGKPHKSKPDRDNVDKGVLDSLWKQDSGIHLGRIEKLWGNQARIEIEIVLEAA